MSCEGGNGPAPALGSLAGRLALAGAGLAAASLLRLALERRPPGGPDRWRAVNHRDRSVSLLAGPALVIAVAGSAAVGGRAARPRLALAVLVAVGGAGAAGLYDDLVGSRPAERATKGFAGHLAAARSGRLSAGAVKVVGIILSALVSTRGMPPPRLDRLLAGGVIAGSANLLNLLDLRPGRALKCALLVGVPLLLSSGPGAALAAGPVGAAAALLGADLDERAMIGDAGANALGAALGLALAQATGRRRNAALLAVLVALTAASELVSFSRVIDATPALAWFDALGRRPAACT